MSKLRGNIGLCVCVFLCLFQGPWLRERIGWNRKLKLPTKSGNLETRKKNTGILNYEKFIKVR